MKALYIEPFSGLSGDMFLGSLCGLLDAYEEILDLPEKLSLPAVSYTHLTLPTNREV